MTNACNSFEAAESICGISWEPQTGRIFAIPFPTEIQLFQRSTWNVIITLTDQLTVEVRAVRDIRLNRRLFR